MRWQIPFVIVTPQFLIHLIYSTRLSAHASEEDKKRTEMDPFPAQLNQAIFHRTTGEIENKSLLPCFEFLESNKHHSANQQAR